MFSHGNIHDVQLFKDHVNPGLINPKRLFNWNGTIKQVSDYDCLVNTPLIFIHHAGWWFGTFGLFFHSVGNHNPN